MVIGILKEIKLNEYRVAMTPDGVHTLVSCNHKVLVEKEAGVGAGFSDEEYLSVGASIVETAEEIYSNSDMVLHIRRPHSEEYNYIKPGQIILGFFHSLVHEQQTRSLIDLKAVCIACESIRLDNWVYPLRSPMSELAGKIAPLEGARYLQTQAGGTGVFLGGVTGVEPATVMIIGSGVVGMNAAKTAAKMGAKVLLFGLFTHQLQEIKENLPDNVITLIATPLNLKKYLPQADIVIGAIFTEGINAHKLISRQDLKLMKPGSVLVDVAIDQGGCFETSKPTTQQDPVYVIDDITHYCVPNMTGSFAKTASIALSNAALPYIIDIATKGWKKSAQENKSIARGIHIAEGHLTNQKLAEHFNLSYIPLDDLLK